MAEISHADELRCYLEPVTVAADTPPAPAFPDPRTVEAVVAWLRDCADEDRYGPRWRPLHYAATAIARGDPFKETSDV